ncbi:MAG: ATP-dependent Clp protease ATP-binding subunit [Candidatus Omnitrophota bacterium]
MRTNFSEEAKIVLQQAKKSSVCMLKPVTKEELVLYALINMQHPLWLVIQAKLKLDENEIKNTISHYLIKNFPDDPSNKANLEQQNKYFDTANEEAKKRSSSLIEPYDLLRAIFLTKNNCILKLIKQINLKFETFLEEIANISYVDLTEAVDSADTHKSYAPSKRLLKATEDYSSVSSDLALTQFGRNLNLLAKEGKLDPVYFRDEEMQTAIEILCKKQQNNPLLIGDAGVGKTAIAEGIAQLIVEGKVPTAMLDKEIVEISITSLVAGTTLRGQFEENIKRIIDECTKNPSIILFIDEIHMVVGAGGEKGLSDAANILKPALARGNLRCIGATTTKENRQFLEKDKALKRRFQPVYINEPTIEQTIKILNKCKDRFEKFHNVKITDEAINAATELADKYIKDRHFPGKSIDLLDHTCAKEKIDQNSDKIVTAEKVAAVIAKDAQVPITQLLAVKTNELALLSDRLKQRVIGQDEAIKELVEVIQLTKMGMDINPQRPEGVFLFVGPSGVGKTELAKSLTVALLGDESRLVSFDMAEFKDETSTSRILGAAPGYIGYEQESRLISSIRSNPNSIILLDEIEKAHPNVLSLLKQIFDKGTLSDADGEKVYFTHATFILTSNIGAEVLNEKQLEGLEYRQLCSKVRNILEIEIKKCFGESFLNSIDKIIYFNPIGRDCIRKIINKKVQNVLSRLVSKGFIVQANDDTIEFLLNKGYSIKFGAKFINKTIEDNLLKPLAQYLLSCKNCKIAMAVSGDKIVFSYS